MASGRNGHTLVDFHLQIYNKNIDNSNKTVVFFYDKTHFLTRLVSRQPLKGLFNIPKPIFTTSPILPGSAAGAISLQSPREAGKKEPSI